MLSWLLNLHCLRFLVNNVFGEPYSAEVSPSNLLEQYLIAVEDFPNERRVLAAWALVDLAFLVRVYTFRLV
jgi:hypothetical protein